MKRNRGSSQLLESVKCRLNAPGAPLSQGPIPRWDMAALLVFLLLAGLGWWFYRDFQPDDAYIAYRYAHNLLSGRGWVYNPGETVNGATSPLHVILLSLLTPLLGDAPRAAHLLGALCLAIGAWFCFQLLKGPGKSAHQMGRPQIALAASLLLVTNPFLLLTYGMETMLYLALALAALYWYHAERLLLCAAALGLLIVTRADGALLAIVLLAHQLITKRRLPIAAVGLTALVAAPWYWYANQVFGSPYPNTLGARIAQGAAGHPRFLPGVAFWAEFSLRETPWYLLLAPCSVAGLIALALRARAHLTLLLWVVLHFCAFALLRVPYQHWYYGPTALGFLVISSFCLLWVESARSRLLATRAQWALMAALFLPVVIAQMKVNYARSRTYPEAKLVAYRQVGSWLNRHTPPGSLVAAWEIGAIGYYSDRPILDYLGLVTPEAQAAVLREDFKWWLRKRPPDYVVAREPPEAFERAATDDPLFHARYQRIATLKAPNFQPMAIYRRVNVSGWTEEGQEKHWQKVRAFRAEYCDGLHSSGSAALLEMETGR